MLPFRDCINCIAGSDGCSNGVEDVRIGIPRTITLTSPCKGAEPYQNGICYSTFIMNVLVSASLSLGVIQHIVRSLRAIIGTCEG